MSKLLSEEQIEVLFQKHLDDRVGSGTRRTFYANNNALEASARTAFKAAFALLMPIIEKQMEALEDIVPVPYDSSDLDGFTHAETIAWQAIQETKKMLEQLGDINGRHNNVQREGLSEK